MPGPRLPIELELHIIDLAMPPRTFYHALDRIRLCKALALVHRDWTARAHHLLTEHALFEIREPEAELRKRLARFEEVSQSGGDTKRLDVWSELDGSDWPLAVPYPNVTMLGMRRAVARTDCARDYRGASRLLAETPRSVMPTLHPDALQSSVRCLIMSESSVAVPLSAIFRSAFATSPSLTSRFWPSLWHISPSFHT